VVAGPALRDARLGGALNMATGKPVVSHVHRRS
jgi:hypothetical protein